MAASDRIRLCKPGTETPSHFYEDEFKNRDGLAKISPLTLEGLGRSRFLLNVMRNAWVSFLVTKDAGISYTDWDRQVEVQIVISENGAVRTDKDNEELAERLGWVGERLNPITGEWDREIDCKRYANAVDTSTYGTYLLVMYTGWERWGKGRVSRDSQHLVSQGATAADINAVIAFTGVLIPTPFLGKVCEKHWDYVKVYKTHVHCDMRDGGVKL